jgi:hypothetical protein
MSTKSATKGGIICSNYFVHFTILTPRLPFSKITVEVKKSQKKGELMSRQDDLNNHADHLNTNNDAYI